MAEIEIFYEYSKLDKEHRYCVVCQQSDVQYGNYWIFWIWYKMGAEFGKRRKFRLFPYQTTGAKLIKSYKTCNSGTDRVANAILSHYKKLRKQIS